MTTLHQHGEVAFAIPPSWADHSTLMFAGPTDAAGRAPVVTITFGMAKQDARAAVVHEVERMAQTDPEMKLSDEGPFDTGFGQGWSVRVDVERGARKLSQLTAAQQVGPMMLLMTGLVDTDVFDAHVETMKRMLASVRPAEA